ncbi:fructosamine kinase family protein [Kroppenstedtia eburnea]|uniref:Fructosamine-3-kinase n=1 Tax=Kroppenstedtia eburnea TaxID=714067 RepID=A0A1N7M4K6_9BACL|nr:fructosamine kinase family protein [Kroppenstedtia eburnea]QKI81825.1 fructosamine kinase family protein [Kroppenstedtia eburnea]SIS81007.1 Fructosamine-3-kinase [Kroppenstedtia eburnea]
MLTPPLKSAVESALHAYGDPGPLQPSRPVSGGEIGQSFRLETPAGRYFFKFQTEAPAGFFTAERDGLETLARNSRSLRIPKVIAHEGPEKTGIGWILMEWIEPGPTRPDHEIAEALGRGVAELHQHTSTAFGLEQDNFIGLLSQPNPRRERWVDFYRDCRLLPQIGIADRGDRLPPRRNRLLIRLLDRLDDWLGDSAISPSLLHGDLWGGNWMVGPGGTPCLIDPAIYYGHREVDLAFTELFGGFPDRFYGAYREAFPLESEYQDRKPLYQLYYLLVHLNHFGESYGSSVDRILKRYAG